MFELSFRVPSIIPNVNELLTDPYMQNMPSTSTDSMSSQWLSTLNANNTFNSDRYNTQVRKKILKIYQLV